MSGAGERAVQKLVRRLLVIESGTHGVAALLTSLVAPRMLLLEARAARSLAAIVVMMGLLSATLAFVLTAVLLRPLARVLCELADGSTEGEPEQVVALYELPSLLSIANVSLAGGVSLAMLVPALRPPGVDAATQIALAVLALTMVSTTTLPAYILTRSHIARYLELVSPRIGDRGLRWLGDAVQGRLRKRYVAAVTLPVALVALASSLLADAHARAFEREARAADAVAVALAALEPLASGAEATAGREAAIAAASAGGFYVEPLPASVRSAPLGELESGAAELSVPLETGEAHVRFVTPRLSAAAPIYALLALAAVVLAALVGTRAAAFFEADVSLATRGIRDAGVSEVMRGSIVIENARFAVLAELLHAIDALGGVFREFASAQRDAIGAREATERMRGLLLASMSHDLKAPLNAVLGFTELVRRSPLTREQLESLAIIEQRGRELLVLIDTILDSARVEAGELELSPQHTLVGDVVMSAVLEVRELLGAEAQIVGEIQPEIPPLLVDGARIVQALTAVVLTASRFSGGGVVPVRSTLSAERLARVRVEVETSGEGLPVAEREKIFDAFKSAESARRQGGLGLGLQLARSIVELHGGAIEVDSTERGGMVFRLWLPRESRRSSSAPST